jgi:hypothetical protein
MDSATEKLELGLQRLAKAGDDADLLGLALQSIHGALEDHFRQRLAADPDFPAEGRAAVLDPRQVQWKDLLDAMQLYGDLRPEAREQIWRMNATRTKVAHGGRYPAGRAELERYAALAQSLLGYTAPEKPARAPAEARRPPARPPAPARSAEPATRSRSGRTGAGDEVAPEISRAVRAEAATRPRSPLGWLVVLAALVFLFGLAGFVALRSAAQSRAQATAAAGTAEPAAEPAATYSPEQAAVATALPRAATVSAAEGLNLRADPALAAALVVGLPNGTRVAIVGGPVEADGFVWWNVEVEGRRGWCAGEYLKFEP